MNYRELPDIIAQNEPSLWRLVLPRLYRDTDRFGNVKLPAIVAATAVRMMRDLPREIGQVDKNLYYSAAKLAQFEFPALFCAPELLNAAAATNPPEGLRWDEMNLPFDAAILMLPTGFLRHPTSGAIDFLAFARVRKGETLRFPLDKCPSVQLTHDAFFIFTACHERPNFPILEQTLNGGQNPFIGSDDLLMGEFRHDGNFIVPLAADDSTFLRDCQSLIFRLLLALEARPALLERGKPSGKHKKTGLPLWSPKVVGQGYRVKSGEIPARNETTLGAAKRLHWRRGHYRNQPIGTGRTERKIIWIEPVLIGTI